MKRTYNKMKSIFEFAHDVKNTLSLMNSYSRLVEMNQEKYLPIFKKTINDTVLSLNDYNNLKNNFDILDVNYLLEEVVDYFKPICNYEGINIKLNQNDDEIFIIGDYYRLKHVIFNLIINAKNALYNINNATITLSSKVVGHKVIIKCVDNGLGIDMEKLNTCLNNKYGSVSISKEIIHEHGGTMLYESAKNSYTKVYIKLDCFNLV